MPTSRTSKLGALPMRQGLVSPFTPVWSSAANAQMPVCQQLEVSLMQSACGLKQPMARGPFEYILCPCVHASQVATNQFVVCNIHA